MSILQTIKTIIRVVLYLRLSDEDKSKLSKEELSIEIVEDFIDKILIGNYDETTNSRDIKIIWNFTI